MHGRKIDAAKKGKGEGEFPMGENKSMSRGERKVGR